jgi:Aspartate-ammonia ligase
MRAVRKDYFLDHDHSAYVDQWDWERVITPEQRTLPFLTEIVQAIWRVIHSAEELTLAMYPQLRDPRYPSLPDELEFSTPRTCSRCTRTCRASSGRPQCGSRVARIVLAALAVIGGGLALVHVFVGPTSAIGPSLVTAALAAALIWLFGPRASKEYFGS